MADGEKQKRGPRTTEGRQRALSNLATRWRHGAYGALPARANRGVQQKVEELTAALTAGGKKLDQMDSFAVEQLAVCLRCVDLLLKYAERNRGGTRQDMKPALDLLRGFQGEIRAWLKELNATPAVRSKLGVDRNKPRSWLAEMHSEGDEADSNKV